MSSFLQDRSPSPECGSLYTNGSTAKIKIGADAHINSLPRPGPQAPLIVLFSRKFSARKSLRNMSGLLGLADAHMARLEHSLPSFRCSQHIESWRVSNSTLLQNLNDFLQCGVPKACSPNKTPHTLWKQWINKSRFARVMAALAAQHGEHKPVMIETTYLQAHRAATDTSTKKESVAA